MSKGWKIALIVSAAVLFLCGVACVSLVIIGRYTASKSIATQPEQAAKIGHEIVDYTLPSGYAEVFGFNMFDSKWVAIGSDSQDGFVVMIMQFPANSSLSQEEMQRNMERSLAQQGRYPGDVFTVVGTQTATLRGQEVTFTVSESKSKSGIEMRRMAGVFQGKAGMVMLMVMGDPKTWDQDTLDSFLASIR